MTTHELARKLLEMEEVLAIDHTGHEITKANFVGVGIIRRADDGSLRGYSIPDETDTDYEKRWFAKLAKTTAVVIS